MQVRKNLHTVLPTDRMKCTIAVSHKDNVPSDLSWRSDADTQLLCLANSDLLAGVQLSEDGVIQVGSTRTRVGIHQVLSSTHRPGLTLTKVLNVDVALGSLFLDPPKLVLRVIPWMRFVGGKEGLLLYAYLYQIHPLITARERFVTSAKDLEQPWCEEHFCRLSPPLWILEFEHDWLSMVGFTLDGILHSVNAQRPSRMRNRRGPDLKTPRAAGAKYSVTAMCDMAGVSNKTLGKYTTKAGVQRAGRGKRNHCFAFKDAIKILEKLISQSDSEVTRAQCLGSLKDIRNRR